MDFEKTVREHKQALAPTARAIAEEESFSLELPVALVAYHGVLDTTLSSLRGHLPCSVALASAPIEHFLALREEYGFDRAFEICSTDNDNGEEFVSVWDQAQKDLAEGVVMTLNDLVAMVEQAKQGFAARPRRMLVVVVVGRAVKSGTVETDWVEGRTR
jgi:hypothetical protein